MRAFIAMELSDKMRNELHRLQEKLKEESRDIKWVKPENIHLTLKFLGEIDDERIETVKAALGAISSRNQSFEISLFKLGAFPGLDDPRVIWVGIDKSCSLVESIALSIEKDLGEKGFPPEERAFSAHLTLGRVKSGRNRSDLKNKLLSIEVGQETALVDRITLFRSTLTPEGPIYAEIAHFNLERGTK